MAPGAAAVWDEIPNNVMVDGERGDKAACDAPSRKAAHVTRLEIRNNRVTGLPMEPPACVGDYDAATGRMTLHVGSQGILIQKRALCGVFGVADDTVRVITRDTGGGFGTRNLIYRESVLMVWAARRIGRPVKYRAERSEAFIADPYGRDLTSTVELALAADGTFLGIRAHNIQNVGSQAIHLIPLLRGSAVANGVYAIPAIHLRLTAVMTNTTPTSTYRGAGRPEAIFLIERLIDTAAAEMGIDRIKLRRMNFIQPQMLPWVNAVGTRYDSGEFDANMMRALAMIDADGFKARRREGKKQGRLRGLGICNYIETATGIPPERAVIKVQSRPHRHHARHPGERAGARDHVCADDGRHARRAVRERAPRARRQRHRHHGLRLAFLPLDAARRAVARAGVRGDHRERQGAGGAGAAG